MKREKAKKARPKFPVMKKRESGGTKGMEFAHFGDRRVEKVELFSSSEYQSINIRFDDNTDLSFVIEAWVTFTSKTDYLISKEGNHRVLKRWPVMRSEET
jgi:hypothetical protein